MRTLRAILAAILATLGLFAAPGAGAAELKEGIDFRVINPPLAADKNRIEVTEFFWYGCPHCFDFEPVLATWVKKLPADVSFRRLSPRACNSSQQQMDTGRQALLHAGSHEPAGEDARRGV